MVHQDDVKQAIALLKASLESIDQFDWLNISNIFMMKIIQIVITFITLIGTVLAFIFTPQINYFIKNQKVNQTEKR